MVLYSCWPKLSLSRVEGLCSNNWLPVFQKVESVCNRSRIKCSTGRPKRRWDDKYEGKIKSHPITGVESPEGNQTYSSTHSLTDYYFCYRISHFSALAGKYSPILRCSNQQDQARWSYLRFRNFLTIEHVPRSTDFCICIYVFECRLSLFRLCDSDFGITPVDDITIGITNSFIYNK